MLDLAQLSLGLAAERVWICLLLEMLVSAGLDVEGLDAVLVARLCVALPLQLLACARLRLACALLLKVVGFVCCLKCLALLGLNLKGLMLCWLPAFCG